MEIVEEMDIVEIVVIQDAQHMEAMEEMEEMEENNRHVLLHRSCPWLLLLPLRLLLRLLPHM